MRSTKHKPTCSGIFKIRYKNIVDKHRTVHENLTSKTLAYSHHPLHTDHEKPYLRLTHARSSNSRVLIYLVNVTLFYHTLIVCTSIGRMPLKKCKTVRSSELISVLSILRVYIHRNDVKAKNQPTSDANYSHSVRSSCFAPLPIHIE